MKEGTKEIFVAEGTFKDGILVKGTLKGRYLHLVDLNIVFKNEVGLGTAFLQQKYLSGEWVFDTKLTPSLFYGWQKQIHPEGATYEGLFNLGL